MIGRSGPTQKRVVPISEASGPLPESHIQPVCQMQHRAYSSIMVSRYVVSLPAGQRNRPETVTRLEGGLPPPVEQRHEGPVSFLGSSSLV
jgi:hypothetical protein